MTPTNSTEKLLMEVVNDNSRSKENKKILINSLAYPDQETNYAAGKPCAVCPPPQARPEFVENLIRSLDKKYIVTIYAAHPGTPLNEDDGTPKFDKGERITSAAGHMWYEISDGEINDAYGFAPIKSGMLGPGEITKKDTIHYENPRYSRTIEITEEHYNKLKEYGELAIDKNNTDFGLYYIGTSNSCIDFTWKALRSAGLKPKGGGDSPYNARNKNLGTFDGYMKVDNNINHIKLISSPFKNSELNTENYNTPPPKTLIQKGLTRVDNIDTDIRIT
ncbi:hypothetical protein [Xenorhabdus bovienii]|uniref:hypothetical protein n=1 Tax=Xenorhabdus bovienii TaxID=40576 RepID=UPI0023B2568F|nr:hypothetical protein [Xenorhabdus bovienii]MDE9434291.1 hypothetical protein [Xenorhabdus bovienii]MDE9491930.1 hypothetical protein [Xenorhabdus bovienii]MDE9508308.1 hypothetical protein [Xenorhabdus bovienii]MDE9549402.1 hypothetical protein [Xenorhabdus bovienii]